MDAFKWEEKVAGAVFCRSQWVPLQRVSLLCTSFCGAELENWKRFWRDIGIATCGHCAHLQWHDHRHRRPRLRNQP